MSNFPTMRNIARPKRAATFSGAASNAYSKLYTGRRGRQQARQWRRNGNWDILAFPTAMLWLDQMCAASAVDADQAVECAEQMTDLWP
jgi:hypothetical protein